jgi:hypothetical protein
MKKVMLIGLMSLSACGVSIGYDYAQFGTEDGINANGDQMNALLTNGKQSPDTKSAAWENADLKQAERTKRALGSGFCRRVFNKAKEQK